MQFLGTDTYFCSQTELGSIGEGRRDISIYTSSIYYFSKQRCTFLVLCDDAFAVSGTVFLDMPQSIFKTLHCFNRHFIV